MKFLVSEEKKKEELHQHKLQFFTNITHEIKTPLTLISTPLEKLYDEENPIGERKKLYQLAFTNIQRLLNLINELMEFRKADVGKSYLKAQKVHLSGLVSIILEQFQDYANKKNVSINFVKGRDEKIWIDKDKVSKIIYNVILNAIKYNVKEGNVQVNLYKGSINEIPQKFQKKFIECVDEEINSYIFLCVTDSGIGITENSLPKIFERFYHEDHDPKNHLGSGIGLALVKSLTLLHKGCIYVSSEHHKGTQIVVGFPTGDNHLKPEEKLISENIEFDPLNEKSEKELTINESESLQKEAQLQEKPILLIIEDNKELRDMFRGHYQDSYFIEEAVDGREGFERAKNCVPDLIISDVMMPEMNGYDLCKSLREDNNTSHIPIILLTAVSSIESQIKGVEYGADVYVTKPFNLKLLDVNIQRMLENNEQLKRRYSADIYATTREIAKNNKDSEFMEQVIALVEENLIEENFSIEDLCITIGMGRSSLYKKIKSITGQSPVEFVRSLRLKKAAKILVTEDVSISEAMFRVEIQSNSYFTKAFKTQFNVTPTEFIQQNNFARN